MPPTATLPLPTPTSTPTPTEDLALAAEYLMRGIQFAVASRSLLPPSFFDNAPQPTWATGDDLPPDAWEARMGAWLARFHNTNALARLNSGLDAELGLLATNGGRPILPGSTADFTSFWNRYRNNPTFEASPGNALVAPYLAGWAIPAQAGCNATDTFGRACCRLSGA